MPCMPSEKSVNTLIIKTIFSTMILFGFGYRETINIQNGHLDYRGRFSPRYPTPTPDAAPSGSASLT